MGIKQSKDECMVWMCREGGCVDSLSISQKNNNKKITPINTRPIKPYYFKGTNLT